MPAVIRVSAVYTMSDQVSGKLAKMAAKVTALEKSLGNANSKLDTLGDHAKKASSPLGDVNKQLNDMKKALGTEKGSGLISRMESLNKKLGKLSGGRDGHQIKVSTKGIKSSERDIERLQAKAALLTSGKHTIKIAVDRSTTDLLHDQAAALAKVDSNLKSLKVGFAGLKKGEAELRSTMSAKTQAAAKQRKVLSEVSRQMQRNTRDANMFKRATRDGESEVKSFTSHLLDMHKANLQAGNAFTRGTKLGAGFARMIPLMSLAVNGLGVALGGLVVMLHGIIAPALSVIGSMKDMVGVVGLLPGVYAAAGVAVGSFMGALKSYFGDSLKNAAKLNEITRQLANVKDPKQRKTLMDQESKLLGTMDKQQQKLTKGVSDLMDQWRELFTSNKAVQERFFGTAYKAIDVARKLIRLYGGDIVKTADAVRSLVQQFLLVVSNNKDLQTGLSAVFRIAQKLVGALRGSIDPLMTFFGRVLLASESPIGHIADSFEGWANSLAKIPVEQIQAFIQKGVDTSAKWARIVKNLAGAFLNIFRAGQTQSDSFLDTLVNITDEFRKWTGGDGFSVIADEFREGMKVARALGRFVKVFVQQFMLLGSDGKVGSSVVDFIDTLTSGLPRMFEFFNRALTNLGPTLTSFIQSLGGFFDLLEAGQPGMKFALQILTQLNKVFGYLIQNVPGLKQLLGVLIAFKTASLIFGGAFGHMFSIVDSGVISLGLFKKKLLGVRAVMKSGGGMAGAAEVMFGKGAAAGAEGAAAGGLRGLTSRTLGSGAGVGAGEAGAATSGGFLKALGRGGRGAAADFRFGPGGVAGARQAGGAGLRGFARGMGSGAAGAEAGGIAGAAGGLAKAAPLIGGAIMAGQTVSILRDKQASGMDKTRGVANLGAIGAAGVVGGPVGAIAAAAAVPAAGYLGKKAYGVDKYQQQSDQADLTLQYIEQLGPTVKAIRQQEQDLTTTKKGWLKASLKGQDLQKQAARTAAVNYALSAGLSKDMAKQVVAETARKQQQARILKLQLDVQNGKVKGQQAIADAAKKAGINNAGAAAKTIADKQAAGIQSFNGKDYAVVKDKAAADQRNQAVAAAGHYGVKVPGADATVITQAALDKKKKDDATQKQMFGSNAAAQANQFKAYTGQVNKQIADQQYALNKAISKANEQGANLPAGFGQGIKSHTKVATTNIQAYGAAVTKQNDATGKYILTNLNGWNDKVAQSITGMATGAAPGAGSSPTSGASPGAAPSVQAPGKASPMAGGGVVPGDPRRPDSVHTLLKPGEVVLNEGQQRKLGLATVKKSLHGPGTAAKGTFGYNMQDAPSSALNYASGGTVPALKPYMDAAVKLGATITSTTGGGHAKNSLHYQGRAFDADGGTPVNKRVFSAFEPDARRGTLEELFFDPSGGYKRGQSVGPIGGHGDHVHTGIAAGAGAAMIGGMKPPKAPAAPNFGTSRMGKATQKRAASMMPAIQARINAAYSGGGAMDFGGANMPGSPKGIGQEMASTMYGWSGANWSNLEKLWTKESGWNPTAENPSSGAYGIPQALPASKLPQAGQKAGGSNPAAQIGWGLNYIKGRYGDPTSAMAHEDRYNWYGRGGEGMVTSPTTIGVGDKREHVQITPSRTEAKPGGAINSVANQGPARANITNNFYVGVLSGDEKALRQFAAVVGDVIAEKIEGAASSNVSNSSEVMSGNG